MSLPDALYEDVRRRRFLCSAILVGAGLTSARAVGVKLVAADRIVLPPDSREFRSASGNYVFTLVTVDHWKSRLALAELSVQSGAKSTSLWQKMLPQEQGPRHVLVADSGAVLLTDEWINVPSRHALLLFAPDGRELARYGIDDIVRLLGVSRRTVADHGRLGLWMSAAPVVSSNASVVTIPSGGRKLTLHLVDGQLTVSD